MHVLRGFASGAAVAGALSTHSLAFKLSKIVSPVVSEAAQASEPPATSSTAARPPPAGVLGGAAAHAAAFVSSAHAPCSLREYAGYFASAPSRLRTFSTGDSAGGGAAGGSDSSSVKSSAPPEKGGTAETYPAAAAGAAGKDPYSAARTANDNAAANKGPAPGAVDPSMHHATSAATKGGAPQQSHPPEPPIFTPRYPYPKIDPPARPRARLQVDESRLRLEVPPVGLTARNRAYIASAGALMACGMGLSLAAIAGSSSLVGSLLLSIPLLGLSYALFMRALVVTCLEEILEFDMAANSWRLVKQLVLPGRRGRTMQQQPTAAAGAGTAAAAGGGRYLGMLQLERGCITDLLPPLLITHANVSLPAAMGPLGQPLGASAVQLSDGESAAYVGEQLAPREQLWLAQELAAAVERAKAERAQQ